MNSCAWFARRAGGDPPPPAPRLSERLAAIQSDPDAPVALCCSAGNQFAWQNPGRADDTPEGATFNQRRDMMTLLRMDLAPGSVLPARVALARLLKAIPALDGMCGGADQPDAWRGCPRADRGYYEAGYAKGIEAIIPARRDVDMAADKDASLRDMLAGGPIPVRPHILVCAVAQYGNGARPALSARQSARDDPAYPEAPPKPPSPLSRAPAG